MLSVRHQQDRGRADFGWLQSRHSFSFGSYYDVQHMGFSALRVINDDRVAPGAGFDTHGHRDMEIISYVLKGEIAHKDSEGHAEILPPGEFQLMSAGAGIHHSEFNPSPTEGLHFLQIWLQPNVYGGAPGYQQKRFADAPGLTLVASPTGEQESLSIKQDAKLYRLQLAPGQQAALTTDLRRHYYVHLVAGGLTVNEVTLTPGDGLKVITESHLAFHASDQPVTALVFDLP